MDQDDPQKTSVSSVDDELAELRAACDDAPTLDIPSAYEGLQARLRADEASLGGRMRAASTRRRLAVAAALVIVPALATGAVWLRPDMGAYSPSHMAVALVALAAAAMLALWVGLRPAHVAPLPRATNALVVAGASIALTGVYLWPALAGATTGTAERSLSTLGCLMTGAVLGVPIYLALRLLDRGATPHGVLLALASGVSANAVLQLHCPATEPAHLIAGHLGVVAVLLGVAGAARRLRAPND